MGLHGYHKTKKKQRKASVAEVSELRRKNISAESGAAVSSDWERALERPPGQPPASGAVFGAGWGSGSLHGGISSLPTCLMHGAVALAPTPVPAEPSKLLKILPNSTYGS